MTAKRFSNDMLYRLRNKIPLASVIKTALGIPWKNTKGRFRFLCPLCNEFDTAVNPATNLARCFHCRKNFNAIDLVMLIRKSGFVDSVRFLEKFYENNPFSPIDNVMNPDTEKHDDGPAERRIKREDRASQSAPVHIGNILAQTMTLDCEYDYQKKSVPVQQDIINERISELERKVDYMAHQIKIILKAIHLSDNPSHQ